MPEPTKVFISYSWNTEKETKIVDELGLFCHQRGIHLVRDNNALKHGASIKKFMNELSAADHVITVFSQPYFESVWCMYELLQLYKRGDFAERTHPVLVNYCDLKDVNYRLQLVKHWKEKYDNIKTQLDEFDSNDVASEFEESKLYRDISQNIDEILVFAKNRVTTPLADLHQQNFAQLLDSIKPPAPQTTNNPIPENSSLFAHDRPVWIDREPQWDNHIVARVNAIQTNGKTFAFVIAGVLEEWPESFEKRMCLKFKTKENQIVPTFTGDFAKRKVCGFWSSILHKGFLNESQLKQLKDDEYEGKLIEALSQSPSQLFSWRLNPGLKDHLDVGIIQDVVRRWEALDLPASSQPHYLMIFYGCVPRGLFNGGERKVEQWRKNLAKTLAETEPPKIVATKLESPKVEEINHWMETYHPDQIERLKLRKALLKKIRWGRAAHLTLLETYLEIIQN